jgi:hypothetical protein
MVRLSIGLLNMAKQNGMVYATGAVLYIGSLLDWRVSKHQLSGTTHPIRGLESSLVAQWIAISVLLIVLAFTVEQAPEFGGPLTLLILVVSLLKYSKAIGITFNETQGKTK